VLHDKLGGKLTGDVMNRFQEFSGEFLSPSGERGPCQVQEHPRLAGGVLRIEPVPGQLAGPRA
jgi:hypothetical protein